MPRKLPAYNSSSLADIAFMLLIFFLVTTTMDVDSGLERNLPQWVDPETLDDTPPIRDRNVFVVLINKSDQLLVEGVPTRVEDLKEKTKDFLDNQASAENMPVRVPKEIPFFGIIEVNTPNAVISLQNDEGTSYGAYLRVQNELIAAINELRDDISKKKFGKVYADLDDDRQGAVKTIFPQKISEAEPKRIGGK